MWSYGLVVLTYCMLFESFLMPSNFFRMGETWRWPLPVRIKFSRLPPVLWPLLVHCCASSSFHNTNWLPFLTLVLNHCRPKWRSTCDYCTYLCYQVVFWCFFVRYLDFWKGITVTYEFEGHHMDHRCSGQQLWSSKTFCFLVKNLYKCKHRDTFTHSDWMEEC